MLRYLLLSVTALLSVGAAVPGAWIALADEMYVAMAHQWQGPIEPELVGTLPELLDGAEFTLGEGAKLVFSPYTKCEQVTVSGVGKLTVKSRGRYSFTGTAQKVITKTCPTPVGPWADPDGDAGGIVLRGGSLGPSVLYTEQPDLVVSNYDPVHVYEVVFSLETDNGKQEVIRFGLSARLTRWPHNGSALKAGSQYEIRLRKNGQNSQTATLVHIANPDKFLPSGHVLLLNFGNGFLK